MLLASASPEGVDIPKVFLEQGDELKGVLGGRPYPRLWITVQYDNEDEFRKLEEELLEAPPMVDDRKLRDYCKLFIREYGTPLFMPFIVGDTIFGEPPHGYEEQYAEVCALWDVHQIGHYLRHPPKSGGKSSGARELEQQIAQIGKSGNRVARKTKRNAQSKTGQR